jgi:hypothetical protein
MIPPIEADRIATLTNCESRSFVCAAQAFLVASDHVAKGHASSRPVGAQCLPWEGKREQGSCRETALFRDIQLDNTAIMHC